MVQESKVRFDADPAFKKQSQMKWLPCRQTSYELERFGRKICEISRVGYQEIYDLLDIHLNERGESFYNRC